MTDTSSELWSWVDAEPELLADVPTGAAVTAVLVTRNGESWLRDALDSVAAGTVRPGTLIVVDNDSDDGSSELLMGLLGSQVDVVIRGQASWGFGQAVAAALEGRPPTDWVWLLHDDVRVHEEALSALLTQTAARPDADVLVPMLLRPGRRHDAPLISELGASISHAGRRELDLEPGEIGQGQHDPEPVLGGSTCGMLLRRETYDRLGGFDPAVPLHRDGVEFGWRATLSGATVMTCPDARIVHRQAGLRGLRDGSLAEQRHRSEAAYDRFLGMRTVLAHARGLGAVGTALRLALGTLGRVIGLLLGKRPEASLEELQAFRDLVTSRRGTRALRRRVGALGATAATRATVKRLRPHTLSALSRIADQVWARSQDRLRLLTASSDMSLDDLTGDDFAGGQLRARAVWPWVAATLALVAMAFAGRRLLGTGPLTSTNLLPAPDTIAAAVHDYVTRSAGAPQSAAPWEGLAAIGSVVGIVPTWAAVVALWVAVPAAALAMASFLQPFVRAASLRWAAALAYALLPALVGGYARGQVWLAVWAVLLPLYAASLDRWPGSGSLVDRLREPAWAALLLTVGTAIAPLSYAVGGLALLVIGIRRAGVVRAVVSVLIPVVVLAPWLPSLVTHPGRLLTGPDPLLGSTDVVPAWMLFLGRSAGAGLPPFWVSAVALGALWLGAVIAFGQSLETWRFAAGGVAGIVLAVGLSRLVVPVAAGSVRPEVTMWLVAGFGCLVVTAVSGLDQARRRLGAQSFGLSQAVSALAVALGAVVTLVSLGWFVVGGLAGPLHRGQPDALPPYITQTESGPLQARTLVVSLEGDGHVSWLLHATDGVVWGDGETGIWPAPAGPRSQVEAVVAQIAAARQDDQVASELASLGVVYVQVRGITPDVSGALAASPGIARGGQGNGTVVFTVTSRPSRVLLVTQDATTSVQGTVDTATTGTLVLSEVDDPRWTVSVGGVPLPRTTSTDWRPAFALTGQTGPVTVTLAADRGRVWYAWGQLIAVLLLALFAAPAASRESDDFRGGRRSADAEPSQGRRSWGGES